MIHQDKRNTVALMALLGAALAACSASTTDTVPNGQGGAGGDGGEGGDGGTGGVEPVLAADCAKGETVVEGSIDGTSVAGIFEPHLLVLGDTAIAEWKIEHAGHYPSLGGFALDRLGQPEETVSSSGILHLPTTGPHAGAFFCAGAGTSVSSTADGQVKATLRSLKRVGACPGGTPVTDQLTACFAGWDQTTSGCIAHVIKGTLAGTALEAAIDPELALADTITGDVQVQAFLEGIGRLTLGAQGFDPSFIGIATRPIDAGYVIAPATGPDPGAIYCIGGGTVTYEYDGIGFTAIEATITTLSRIGNCESPALSGEVSICSYL